MFEKAGTKVLKMYVMFSKQFHFYSLSFGNHQWKRDMGIPWGMISYTGNLNIQEFRNIGRLCVHWRIRQAIK